MSPPLVSIVVPTYDRAGFVETAIMSLLEQDYPALEVIVVDDGSHDDTPAVLARIAEQIEPGRLRCLRHENVGQPESINRGFAEARGELLGYLSSDDYLLPGAISRLVAAAEEHPTGEVFYSSFLVVDENDRVTDTVHCLQHTFVDSVRWALCIPVVAALVRRSCYERIGGWDPRFRYSPDYEWWLRAGDVEFVRVSELGGALRAHAGSISTGDYGVGEVRKRLDERFLMLDAIYARADLSAEVRAVEKEAYATTLIELGMMLGQEEGTGHEPRFAIEDNLGELFSQRAAEGAEKSRLWSERQRRYAEQRATAAEYVNSQLQQTSDALREAAAERERHITLLEERRTELTAEVERAHSQLEAKIADAARARAALATQEARPRWLRIARELTPPPWRDRAGAALHRARRKIRS